MFFLFTNRTCNYKLNWQSKKLSWQSKKLRKECNKQTRFFFRMMMWLCVVVCCWRCGGDGV